MRVPSLLNSYVKTFCRELVPNNKPLYVPVDSLPNKPLNECFLIVPDHVASSGGTQLIGWQIREWKKVLIEAELHAVWQRPDRVLIDITPKDVPTHRILFVPDPSRQYTGVVVDNIRKPLRKDPRIKRFCDLVHERFLELNKGDLADQHGEIELTGDAAIRFSDIQQEMAQLEHELVRTYGNRR
jgi:hypothetical protein